MEEKTKLIGRDFWIRWVIATSAGFAMFSLIGSIILLADLDALILLLLLFSGIILGVPQSFVLKKYVNWSKQWAKGTSYIFPYTLLRIAALQLIINILVEGFNNGNSLSISFPITTLIYGSIFGGLLANDQKKHLEDQILFSKWWSRANILTWSLGIIISIYLIYYSLEIYSIFNLSIQTINPIFIIVCLGGIIGLVLGMISGLSMKYELNQNNVIEEPVSKILTMESP